MLLLKIGIVTLYGLFNYGNRLQNYALSRVLTDHGFEVDTLAAVCHESKIKQQLHRYLMRTSNGIKVRPSKDRKKEKEFKRFTREYIPTRIFCNKTGILPSSLDGEYDCFIVGSDQVWNPLFWGSESSCSNSNSVNYFLKFSSDPRKRLSYAASFGVDSIPERWIPDFRYNIERFGAVSVRELAGSRLIKEIVGRDVPVVLDPTMLVNASDWLSLSKHVEVSEKYCLVINLGDMAEDQIRFISECKKSGYKIIELMSAEDAYYGASPEEYLSLIYNAECILTDSFHAAVFSILFHRPFKVYSRKHRNNSDMGSRIETLISVLGISIDSSVKDGELFPRYDYDRIEQRLNRLREESLDYLLHAVRN